MLQSKSRRHPRNSIYPTNSNLIYISEQNPSNSSTTDVRSKKAQRKALRSIIVSTEVAHYIIEIKIARPSSWQESHVETAYFLFPKRLFLKLFKYGNLTANL